MDQVRGSVSSRMARRVFRCSLLDVDECYLSDAFHRQHRELLSSSSDEVLDALDLGAAQLGVVGELLAHVRAQLRLAGGGAEEVTIEREDLALQARAHDGSDDSGGWWHSPTEARTSRKATACGEAAAAGRARGTSLEDQRGRQRVDEGRWSEGAPVSMLVCRSGMICRREGRDDCAGLVGKRTF